MQVFGPVDQMSESAVTQLGCLTQGFSKSELEKLPFLLDNMEEIGRCGFNESQVMMTRGGKSIYILKIILNFLTHLLRKGF